MRFIEALATMRPLRRRAWWKHDPSGPGDRWLVLSMDGEWEWLDGKPANPPMRPEYFCDDWETMPEAAR